MTLKCPYSTEQMYNERINGIPISEIVKKTGIKRKTWNKRFERYEKQLMKMATNNTSHKINENVAITNGDNQNANEHGAKLNPIILLIGLIIIGLIALAGWVYDRYKEWRTPN